MDIFDMYFASIAAMQFHPGAGRGEHVPLTLEECAEVALKMVEIRERLYAIR